MTHNDATEAQRAIAAKLHEVNDLVLETAEAYRDNHAVQGVLSSISVLLRQPLEVADRLTAPGGQKL